MYGDVIIVVDLNFKKGDERMRWMNVGNVSGVVVVCLV